MFNKSIERERLLKEFRKSLAWMNANFDRLDDISRSAFYALGDRLDAAYQSADRLPKSSQSAQT